jgi:hypothetical protein
MTEVARRRGKAERQRLDEIDRIGRDALRRRQAGKAADADE